MALFDTKRLVHPFIPKEEVKKDSSSHFRSDFSNISSKIHTNTHNFKKYIFIK